MPVPTEDEIKAKIADGSIFAVSVDTAVFDRYKCNLDSKVLRALDQFKNRPTRVIFSSVIIGEIENHISENAGDTLRELKRALRSHRIRWKHGVEENDLPTELNIAGDPKALAQKQVEDFIRDIGGEILDVNAAADVSAEAFRRYFDFHTPFEDNEKKRHEFPDAFALLSLEALATQNQKQILCVSPDKGWQSFAAQSDVLVCVDDLSVALSYFNPPGLDVVERTIALWKTGDASELQDEIDREFEYQIDGAFFHAEIDSGCMYDSEPISSTLQNMDLETLTYPVIVASDDDTVTFSISVEALIGFEASFDFIVKDGIDRDYVHLDSAYRYEERIFEFQLVLTITREIDDEPIVVDVEVIKPEMGVHFGYAEPYENENPTHEMY